MEKELLDAFPRQRSSGRHVETKQWNSVPFLHLSKGQKSCT